MGLVGGPLRILLQPNIFAESVNSILSFEVDLQKFMRFLAQSAAAAAIVVTDGSSLSHFAESSVSQLTRTPAAEGPMFVEGLCNASQGVSLTTIHDPSRAHNDCLIRHSHHTNRAH